LVGLGIAGAARKGEYANSKIQSSVFHENRFCVQKQKTGYSILKRYNVLLKATGVNCLKYDFSVI
jgi:hypothetical protein